MAWLYPAGAHRHTYDSCGVEQRRLPTAAERYSEVLHIEPRRELRLTVRARPFVSAVATFRLVGDRTLSMLSLQEEPTVRVIGNLAVVSPHIEALGLEAHGLTWRHAPDVLAHPTLAGPTALLSRDEVRSAASLDRFAPGDGDAMGRAAP